MSLYLAVTPSIILMSVSYSTGTKRLSAFSASSMLYSGSIGFLPARMRLALSLSASPSCMCALSRSMISERREVAEVA